LTEKVGAGQNDKPLLSQSSVTLLLGYSNNSHFRDGANVRKRAWGVDVAVV